MDNTSKFGTLTQQKEPYKLKLDMPYHFQVGRTVLQVILEQPCFGCCAQMMNPTEIEKGICFDDYFDMFPKALQDIYLKNGFNLPKEK